MGNHRDDLAARLLTAKYELRRVKATREDVRKVLQTCVPEARSSYRELLESFDRRIAVLERKIIATEKKWLTEKV